MGEADAEKSSSDEDEYMSDSLLRQIEEGERKRKRLSYSEIRRQKERDRAEEDRQRQKVGKGDREKRLRIEGLDTAIPSSNKGYQLLAKMGFDAGRVDSLSEDRLIPINVRSAREGLGKNSVVSSDIPLEMSILEGEANPPELSAAEFVSTKADEFKQKKTLSDIRSLMISIEEMEKSFGTKNKHFWYSSYEYDRSGRLLRGVGEDEVDAGVDQIIGLSEVQQFQILNRHARNVHFYCIWCGTQYENSQLLSQLCPGPSEEQH